MTQLAVRPSTELSAQRSAAEIVAMKRLVQEVMRDVMKKDEHYGVIPGCGTKPALLKPGAETLCALFRLAAIPTVKATDLGNGHREYFVETELRHIPTGDVWGVGVGSCSTMESKYRWRGGARICPECGKDAIIKGKAEYGGGWLCFAKKGGCGAKWADGSREIESQSIERMENPDIADVYNTVLKMAKKRSQVDGCLSATGASDIFTQDIEELAATERHGAAQPVETAEAEELDALLDELAGLFVKIDGKQWAASGTLKAVQIKAAAHAKRTGEIVIQNGKPTVAFVRSLIAQAEGKISESSSAPSVSGEMSEAEKRHVQLLEIAGSEGAASVVMKRLKYKDVDLLDDGKFQIAKGKAAQIAESKGEEVLEELT